MIAANRIPQIRDLSFNSMSAWFVKLDALNILFHPDDAPETIIDLKSGQRSFNQNEVSALNAVLEPMFALHGDKVYDAAYPVFMARMGINEND